MSTSETITRTDLANILNEVLPIGIWVAPTKTKTLTGTTDANGNLSLGLSSSAVPSVVSAVGSNYVFTPFVYSGNWYAKVVSSNSSSTPIVSESVSVTISYFVGSVPLDSHFVVKEFESSGGATYSAFSSGNFSIPIPSPTGYKPFAVLGTRTNGNIVVSYPDVYLLNSSSTSVIVWIRNPTNSTISITSVSIGVLFIKE